MHETGMKPDPWNQHETGPMKPAWNQHETGPMKPAWLKPAFILAMGIWNRVCVKTLTNRKSWWYWEDAHASIEDAEWSTRNRHETSMKPNRNNYLGAIKANIHLPRKGIPHFETHSSASPNSNLPRSAGSGLKPAWNRHFKIGFIWFWDWLGFLEMLRFLEVDRR